MNEHRPRLLGPHVRTQKFVDGRWADADSGAVFAVDNPATGTKVADVANCDARDAEAAIQAAKQVFPIWSGTLAKERAGIMRRWHDLILAFADDLAKLLTTEQGKTLAEAKAEVAYGASFVEWFAEQAKRVSGETLATTWSDRRLITLPQAIGVVAAITPWNFPVAMITRKISPAIAAGCTIVVKPAEQTPLCALALADLAMEAGMPPGVINVLPASAENSIAIGKILCDSPDVRKLSFTGSTEVGRILMRQSAATVKRLSLELGGHAPFIVFDDADVDAAVEGAILSKYRNAGQTCVCANRFLVQAGIYDDFAARLTRRGQALMVGNGLDAGVQQGPLIDEAAIAKVERHVEDAVSKGAHVLTGGKRHVLGGRFYEPTVLTNVTTGMQIFQEETFGPVAGLIKFSGEAEAIQLANKSEFGLAAYLYSRDLGRVVRVMEALEYGMVGVNTGIITNEVAPFGGVKQSGFGKEGSVHGIEEYLELKYVCLGGITA